VIKRREHSARGRARHGLSTRAALDYKSLDTVARFERGEDLKAMLNRNSAQEVRS
jgi:hypothetical protein